MSEEEKVVRKKTTKKGAKKTTKKVARKNVAKKTIVKKIEKHEESVQVRKAPTAVSSRNAEDATNRIVLFVGLGFVSLLIISSAVIGILAEGSIDIATVTQEQREGASPEEIEKINSIAVQGSKKRLPNGGLTPTPNHGTPPAKKKDVPVVASTTDEVASSTDEVVVADEDIDEQAVVPEADGEESTAAEPVEESDKEISSEEVQ